MSSTVNPFNNSTINVPSTGTTENGTKIVTKAASGGAMDKNSFLKILAAELSNLDPSQNQDSTTYVTQMAQFASIEQANNLNSTMTKSSYQNLIGKNVTLSDTDSSGNAYTGVVKAITTDSSDTTFVNIDVTENGSTVTKSFNASDIFKIEDSSESETNMAVNTVNAVNTSFLAASALKGQSVVVTKEDSDNNTIKVAGTIKGVYIDNGIVKIRVTKEDGTTEEYPYSSVIQAGDLPASKTTSGTGVTA